MRVYQHAEKRKESAEESVGGCCAPDGLIPGGLFSAGGAAGAALGPAKRACGKEAI